MSGSVYFTIFQTFMSGPDGTPYFGDYPADFLILLLLTSAIEVVRMMKATGAEFWIIFLPLFNLV